MVAQRVNRAESKRIDVLKQIIGDPERANLLYLVWLGFLARGQRLPRSRKQFPQIARAMLKLFPPRLRGEGSRPKRKA